MELERDNGAISFAGGTLEPNLQRDNFLSAPFARNAKLVLGNGSWETYEVQIEADVLGTVVFNTEKLVEVRLFMTGVHGGNWTKEEEVTRKDKHDRWLHSKLGVPPYSYKWGKIESNFDPRSECSQIIVRYH